MRNLVSLKLRFRGDRASVHAVSSLSEDASYCDKDTEVSEEADLSRSAEPIATVDNPIDPAAVVSGSTFSPAHPPAIPLAGMF